jgi:hypothetical protein
MVLWKKKPFELEVSEEKISIIWDNKKSTIAMFFYRSRQNEEFL